MRSLSYGMPWAVRSRERRRAQQPASPRRIGFLLVGLAPDEQGGQEFRQGLLDAGYVEGRDVVIEWRSANGDYARLPELVADLVQRKVDVIVVDSTHGTQAVKRATSTIPIVMTVVADPVGSGLVASLAHPGGNVTGLSIMATDLRQAAATAQGDDPPAHPCRSPLESRHAVHPKVIEDLKAAAPSLSIELSFVGVRTPEEFGPAFSAVSRAHAQALYVVEDVLFFAIERRLSSWRRRPGYQPSTGRDSSSTKAD